MGARAQAPHSGVAGVNIEGSLDRERALLAGLREELKQRLAELDARIKRIDEAKP